MEHGRRLAAIGADVVEVGGESLRFAPPSPPEVEIGRVVPVIERLAAELDVPVAVDTYKPAVAARRRSRPARRSSTTPPACASPAMAEAVAAGGVGVVAAHFFGPPKVRPAAFPDVDVPAVVAEWARERVALGGRGRDPGRAARHRPGRRPRQVAAPGPRPAAPPRRGRGGSGGRCWCRSPTRRCSARSPAPRPPSAWPRRPPRWSGAGRVGRPCSGSTTWASCATRWRSPRRSSPGVPERWHDVVK